MYLRDEFSCTMYYSLTTSNIFILILFSKICIIYFVDTFRFLRGQPVFIEGRNIPKFPAVISAIRTEAVSSNSSYLLKTFSVPDPQPGAYKSFSLPSVLLNTLLDFFLFLLNFIPQKITHAHGTQSKRIQRVLFFNCGKN